MMLRRFSLIAATLLSCASTVFAQTAPLLTNPSFEADHFTNFPGLVSSNRALTGWFAVGNVGLNPIADGRSPYADNGAVPQGTQVAFIQSGGLLRQTLAGFIVGGVYQVQYAENACGQCLTPAITVTVGTDTVVASHPVFPVGGSNSYHQVVSAPFVAIATSLQISFQNTVAGSGSTNAASSVALIDNVSISLLSTGSTSQVLVPTGADWKYLDNGSDLGTVWQQIAFDDSSWFSGPAQLGYGDGDERTVVGYGPNSNFKYLTTYFRRAFSVNDPNSLAALTVRLLRDDGGIVYINGVEVFRSNMPEGFVNINTFASTTIPNADETRFFPKLIDPAVLVQGTNIIAVEIHQAAYNSSDISFDLDLVAAAAVGPPSIVTQPHNVVTATGGNAYFSVKASGSSPLSYQWQFAGADVPGATNANLVLTNVSAANRGRYSVTVSNPLGSVGSAKALLTLVDLTGDYFQITGLSAANSSAVEHFNVTGDDRGGIAASLGELFVTGDASTARFNLNDLSSATSLGIVYDGLVSDLRSGRVFVLAKGSVPLTAPGGTVDTLLEINTLTGGLGSASIALSAPVKLTGCSGCMGVFSGFGRIVLYNGTNAFLIALPSGVVQDLGPVFLPSHMFSENWAYWGVVEYFADANWIVYVRDYQNIVRTRLPDGLTLPVAAFSNLSDMASFTVSPLLNRWYFHHQYTSQFRSGAETAGYADASLAHEHQVQPPAILDSPRDRVGKVGSDAVLEVIPSGFPLAYQWQFNGVPITDATNRLLSLTNLSAADVGLYNVIVANASGSITSSVAFLNVTVSGSAVSSVAIFAAEPNTGWNDDVRSKIQGSGLFSQVDVIPASGGFPTPTLEQLRRYDAVLFYSDGSIDNPVTVGNLLADYVDSGRGLVVATFVFNSGIQGRIINNYLPFQLFTGQSSGSSLTLVPDDPGHPILTGISRLNGGFSSYHNSPLTVVPGATVIAHWSNGQPLVGVRPAGDFSVVALNFFPPSTDVRGDFWDAHTDGGRLMANALLFSGGGAGETVPFVSPGIRSQPTNSSVLEGLSAGFTVSSFGSPPLAFQWFFEDSPIAGATNRHLSLVSTETNQTGNYFAIITNLYGAVTSQVVRLTVQPTRGIIAYFTDFNTSSTGLESSILNSQFTPLPVTDPEAFDLSRARIFMIDEIGSSPSPALTRILPAVKQWVSGGGKLIVHQRSVADLSSNPLLIGNSVTRMTNADFSTVNVDVIPGTLLASGPHGLLNNSSLDNGEYSLQTYTVRSTLPPGSASLLTLGGNSQQLNSFAYQLGSGVVYYSHFPLDYYLDFPNSVLFPVLRDVYVPNLIEYVSSFTPSGSLTIYDGPSNLSITAGQTANFFVSVSGQTPFSYQWSFNGTPISGATGNPLVLTNVQDHDAGGYSVVVNNSQGQITSSSASLSVLPRLNIALYSDANFTSQTSRDHLRAALIQLGHSVNAVTNFTDAITNDVLVFPQIINGLSQQIDPENRPLLEAYVRQGNPMLVQGGYSYNLDFINNLFGFSLQTPGYYTGIEYTRGVDAVGTRFTNGPTKLLANLYTYPLYTNTLPPGARSLYEYFGLNALSLIPYGNGSVVYLGWDWYDLVSQDGGWTEALGRALQSKAARPPATITTVPFVSSGSVWRFLDNGSNQGTNWQTLNFDDRNWASGKAQLGYGDGDEATIVGYGPNPNAKYITTYFRRSFTLTNASLVSGLTLRLIRDDGAAIYLNGVEVVRDCLYSQAAYDSPAYCTWEGDNENQWNTYTLDPARLRNGLNVLAVEVHQSDGYSSDLSFDLELLGNVPVSPPVVRTQPVSHTVMQNSTVILNVIAAGSDPLTYQWRLDGGNLIGATNAILVLRSLSVADNGNYSVLIRNSLGSVISSNALVQVISLAGEQFRIADLSTNSSIIVEHSSLGGGHGGVAASSSAFLFNGSAGTIGFELPDLANGTNLQVAYSALVSDLKTETVYALGTGSTPITSDGGLVTALLEINSTNGTLTGANIPLSQPILLRNPPNRFGEVGIFAGLGRVTLFDGRRAWNINLPSGQVVELGSLTVPVHAYPQTWAYWGVTEFFDNALWLVYVRDSQAIVRTRTFDGFTTNVAVFSNLSDMAEITMSLPLNRWYFHYQGSSQFGGFDQTVGFADAIFATSLPRTPPVIVRQPTDETIASGGAVIMRVAAKGSGPLQYQWFLEGQTIPNETNSVLKIGRARIDQAGHYSVSVSNELDGALSSSALLTVVPLEGPTFRIATLSTNHAMAADDLSYSGSDLGSFSLANSSLFYSGGYGTVRFDLTDVGGGTNLGRSYDWLVGDLQSRRTYALGQGTNLLDRSSRSFTTLLQIDDAGDLTGERIDLSEPVSLGDHYGSFGLFAGMGRIVVSDGIQVRTIELPSGTVLPLGPLSISDHMSAQIGAYWGIAEFYDGATWLVYVRDYQTIVRIRVGDGLTETVASFSNLGGMSAISVSVPFNRWYFHHQYQSQFNSLYYGAVGFADATFESSLPVLGPAIAKGPVNQTVGTGGTVQFRAVATGTGPLDYQWLFDGNPLLGATDSTLVVSNVSPAQAGSYAIIVSHGASSVTSAPALLQVVPSQTIAVFNDFSFVYPYYVDSLRASIEYLGHETTSFTSMASAAGGTVPLLFPPFEADDIQRIVTAETRESLEGFVARGGTLIVHASGSDPNRSARFLNSAFGFQLAVVGVSPPLIRSQEAADTRFADDPELLASPSSTLGLLDSSLPSGARRIYQSGGADPVVLIPFGSGKIIFLGWNWYSAAPLGSEDGGWLHVLESAIEENGRFSPQAPQILVQPADQLVIAGTTARLRVVASGYPLDYQWLHDGQPVPGGTNFVLQLAGVTAAAAGKYSVVVSNTLGVAVSSNALLQVQPPLFVGVYDDERFVRTSGGPFAESDTLQASIAQLGHVVHTFVTIPTAITNQVLVFPPFLFGDPTFSLDAGSITALQSFVRNGGLVIMHGAYYNVYFLNSVFGLSLSPWGFVGGEFQRSTLAAGTAFEIAPGVLPYHPDIYGINRNSLGTFGPRSIYSSGDISVLSLIPQGFGNIIYVAWSWNDAQPLGSQDGGWIEVLGRALLTRVLPPGLPLITTQPLSQDSIVGLDATFSVTAAGQTPLRVQWYHNSQALSDATNSTLNLPSLVTSQAGDYVAVVSNSAGSVTSQVARLEVRPSRGLVGYYGDNLGISSTRATSLIRAGFTPAAITDISTYNLSTLDGLMIDEYNYGNLSAALLSRLPEIENWVLRGGKLIIHDWLSFQSSVGNPSVLAAHPIIRSGSENNIQITPPAANLLVNGPFGSLTHELLSDAFWSANGYAAANSLPPGAVALLNSGSDTNHTIAFSYALGSGAIYYAALPLGSLADRSDQYGVTFRMIYTPNLLEYMAGLTPSGPPLVVLDPADIGALGGGMAKFEPRATGQMPLDYQWFFNGQPLPGETNLSLTIPKAADTNAGDYQIRVQNPLGSVTSRIGHLTVIQAAPFKITALNSTGSAVVDHDAITGDDRGGIAVSSSHLFYTGDNATGFFSATNLSGGVSLAQRYDALVSNLRTETVYSLADESNLITGGGGVVSSLIEIDGLTGQTKTNRIQLSKSIPLGADTGIFAGYDAIALYTGTHVYRIDLPTGLVTDLGVLASFPHDNCENWAYWGVAEFFDGIVHLVYVRDSQNIARTDVPSGTTTNLATFSNLSDMCSFTVSVPRSRWYFHHEGSSQFGGSSETVGFASATFDRPPRIVTTLGNRVVAEDQTLGPIAFTIQDESPGNQILVAGSSSNPALLPATNIVFGGANFSRTFTLKPAPDQFGTSVVTITLTDSIGLVTNRSFVLTVSPVNDAPSFTGGGDISVAEDSPQQTIFAWASSITAGPTNENDQTLTFRVTNDAPALFLAQPAIGSNGTLTFTPAADLFGVAHVTVSLQDNAGTENGGQNTTAARTFTITVQPVNDPPSFVKGADVSVPEDSGPQSIPGWASNIRPGPPNESSQSVVFQVDAISNATLFATAPAIAPNGTLTFTPAPNASGMAAFSVRLHDDGGTANGGTDLSPPQTLLLTIQPVNDAPAAIAQNLSVPEDTTLPIILSGADIDGDALSYAIVTPPVHGTLSGTSANRTYLPATNFFGTDSFTFKVSDGQLDSAEATIAITIMPANDPPLATAQAVQTSEDTPIEITLTGLDVDGDAVTFSVVALPEHGVLTGSGSNRIYSPATNFYGQDHFTFKANDGQVDSAEETITINVLPANDPPEAYGQSVAVTRGQPTVITLSGFDIDGDTLTYKIISLPAHGILTGADAAWSYQSAAGFSGIDNFTFAANDGTADSLPATVILTVSANEAPLARIVISPLVYLTPGVNGVIISPNNFNALAIVDGSGSTDPDNDPLSFAWYEGSAGTPFASSSIARRLWSIGRNPVRLVVSDGKDTGTALATLDVISSADAVRQVIALVESSALSQKVKQQIMKELEEAVESFQNGRFKKAVGALDRFQKKVETQVSRQNLALAALLTEAAQKIIQAQTPSRLTVSHEKRDGPLRLSFVPDDACDFSIEYSTNLIDWTPLTNSIHVNASEVLDPDGAKAGQRFYRAVVGHCN